MVVNDRKINLVALCGKKGLNEPGNEPMLTLLRRFFPTVYEMLERLYKRSNGIRVNINGTIILPFEKLYLLNKNNKYEDNIQIGVKNFQDKLFVREGKIVQTREVEREDGVEGVKIKEWDSAKDFLEDEYAEKFGKIQQLKREKLKGFWDD